MKIKLVKVVLGVVLFASLLAYGNNIYVMSTTDLVHAMTREDR